MAYSNSHKPREIMIVSGMREDLSLLSSMLTSHGFAVRSADSGYMALAMLERRRPDLMLLDDSLQEIYITQLCRRGRAHDLAADMPVIFLTAAGTGKERAPGRQAGEADFIVRPYREEEVLLRVCSRLEACSLKKELEDSRRSLFAARQTLRATLMSMDDGVICTDENGCIAMINDAARRMTGWHGGSAVGMPSDAVFRIKSAPAGPMQKEPDAGRPAGFTHYPVLISKDGTQRPVAHSTVSIRDAGGKPAGMVQIFRDVTRERLHSSEIEFLSFHDHLTELYNRRFLEAELRRLDETGSLPITLVIGDLNGLKITNDAFGHFAGDDLLRKTAAILKKCFRPEDIISRYGGDEFAILMPNTTSQAAEALVKRTLAKIKESKSGKGVLSVSFGWDTKTTKSQSISQMLKNAEDNMYKRKLLESPSIRSATISAIVKTLYEKNSREEAHSERVSELSAAIGQAMGLPESEINKSKSAGLLHDIGKIAISNEVLEKNGPLTLPEWDDIKRHPETARRILSGVAEMADLAETVCQHHERWDGKGYPRGLKGEEITFAARIICVADAFDAMTSKRPYRNGMPVQEAREELRRQAGLQFDPEVVRAFLDSGLA